MSSNATERGNDYGPARILCCLLDPRALKAVCHVQLWFDLFWNNAPHYVTRGRKSRGCVTANTILFREFFTRKQRHIKAFQTVYVRKWVISREQGPFCHDFEQVFPLLYLLRLFVYTFCQKSPISNRYMNHKNCTINEYLHFSLQK